jgi:hypothetical protein
MGESFPFDGKYPFIFEKDWGVCTGANPYLLINLDHSFLIRFLR